MKSRIRSRWHRPNEKPLENERSSTPAAPMGEIDAANPVSLTDDLSNFKPSENAGRPHSRNEDRGNRSDDRRGGRKPREDNRQPRQRRDRGENRPPQDNKSPENSESNKPHNRKNHKPRRKPGGTRNNDHSSKPRSENPKHSKNRPGGPRKSHSKAPAKTPVKATGLKGFLGKIFGS